jgi:hypothetical protein
LATGSRETAGGLGNRQKQCHGATGEAVKAMVFVKPDSYFIFCIDDEREDCGLGPHGARDRIDDEGGAKAASAKSLVDREPADKACRKGRVTG